MHIDTYTLIHFYFHSVHCTHDIVRVKYSFSFYLYPINILGSVFCHLREIIAILDRIHESINLKTIIAQYIIQYNNTIVIYTVIFYKIAYRLQNLCTAQLYDT